jgi:1-acyl-sn-glycerol-3-phosphate acyltransferase
MAALPVRLGFVAKAELAANVVLREVLKRLDVVFVERFDSSQAIEDTRRLKDLAATGQSLLFFAEGTFRRMPGLLPFQMGAFLIAAENNLEVVPITIRGTRAELRSESWFPPAVRCICLSALACGHRGRAGIRPWPCATRHGG